MKSPISMTFSAICGFGCGVMVSWSGAHGWNVVLTTGRLAEALTFFVVSAFLSVLMKSLNHSNFAEDVIRAFAFLLGAAFCFSLVRQEANLLVYSSLWAVAGTFLGAAISKVLFKPRRTDSIVANARFELGRRQPK